ncbi:RHS repeat-associated core domain-containing protein [Actinomadura keratinilytica]
MTTTYTDAEGRQSRLREYTKKDRSAWRDTTYHYDALDQLTKIVEPGGAEYTFSYDARGRQTATTDPDGGRTTYEFDATDNLVATTNPNGERLVTTYDKAGRPTSLREDSADGKKRLEWTYDTLGKVCPPRRSATTTRATPIARRSPPTTRPTVPSPPAPPSRRPRARSPARTTTGTTTPTPETSPGSSSPRPEPSPPSAWSSATPPPTTCRSPSPATPPTSRTSPTPASARSCAPRRPVGRKLFSSYYYDEFSRQLTRTVHDRGVQPALIDDTGYTYDDAGNLTSIKRTPGQGMPDGQAPRHPVLRLRPAPPDDLRLDRGRRHLHRRPQQGDGRRRPAVLAQLHLRRLRQPHRPHRARPRREHRQGHQAHLLLRRRGRGPNRLAEVASEGPGGTTRSVYGYDKAGNTTTRQHNGTTQTLKWDPEGALTEVSEPVEGGTTKTTKYLNDASGERLLRHGPDGSTTLYLGETELTAKPDGTTTTERFYSHPDGSTTVRSSDGGLQVLLADHHGSTQTSVDMTQASMPVTRRQLTPFGEDRGEAPSRWPGGRGFVGGLKDEDTGLTQLGARPYDPATGRFLSVDPMVDFTDPATINPYAYANNALPPSPTPTACSSRSWSASPPASRSAPPSARPPAPPPSAPPASPHARRPSAGPAPWPRPAPGPPPRPARRPAPRPAARRPASARRPPAPRPSGQRPARRPSGRRRSAPPRPPASGPSAPPPSAPRRPAPPPARPAPTRPPRPRRSPSPSRNRSRSPPRSPSRPSARPTRSRRRPANRPRTRSVRRHRHRAARSTASSPAPRS